jgi:uncharacterized small protein (DUF1192 family)
LRAEVEAEAAQSQAEVARLRAEVEAEAARLQAEVARLQAARLQAAHWQAAHWQAEVARLQAEVEAKHREIAQDSVLRDTSMERTYNKTSDNWTTRQPHLPQLIINTQVQPSVGVKNAREKASLMIRFSNATTKCGLIQRK